MPMPYYTSPYASPYPVQFPQQMLPNQFNQPQTPNQTGLIVAWVQGEQAMKSYSLGPNQKAFLFNTEENNFGIKSTDANGMPSPLEMFAFYRITGEPKQQPQEQITTPQIDTSTFITREEFEDRVSKLMSELEFRSQNRNNQNQNRGDNKHGK